MSPGASRLNISGEYLDLGVVEDLMSTPNRPPRLGLTARRAFVSPDLFGSAEPVQVEKAVDASIGGAVGSSCRLTAGPLKLKGPVPEGSLDVEPKEYKQGDSAVRFAMVNSVTEPIAVRTASGNSGAMLTESFIPLFSLVMISLRIERAFPVLKSTSTKSESSG